MTTQQNYLTMMMMMMMILCWLRYFVCLMSCLEVVLVVRMRLMLVLIIMMMVQVMWDDVFGEPEGVRSADCAWQCSHKCFHGTRFVCFVDLFFSILEYCVNDDWQVLLLSFSDDNICSLSCILLRWLPIHQTIRQEKLHNFHF